MPGKSFKRKAGWSVLLALAVLLAASPAHAADPQLSPTQQTAYDRTVAAADSASAAKLAQQYRDYESLLRTSREWEQKIAALRSKNTQQETTIRQRISQIDAAKLAKLKQAFESAKTQYQKTNALYRSAKQQLETAKKLKTKWVTDILNMQVEALKLSAEQARLEMKARETAYQTAKKAASAKMKKIRDTLSGIQKLQTQFRASKSALKSPKESRATLWKSFTSSLTKRDAPSATRFLTSVNQLSRQIVELQQKLHQLETRIADTLRTAETQLNQA